MQRKRYVSGREGGVRVQEFSEGLSSTRRLQLNIKSFRTDPVAHNEKIDDG